MTSASLAPDVQVAVGRQLLRRRRHRLSEASVPERASLDRRRVDARTEVVGVERVENLVVAETLVSETKKFGVDLIKRDVTSHLGNEAPSAADSATGPGY